MHGDLYDMDLDDELMADSLVDDFMTDLAVTVGREEKAVQRFRVLAAWSPRRAVRIAGRRPMRQARATRTGRVTTARRTAAHRSTRSSQASGPDGEPAEQPAPLGALRRVTSPDHLKPALRAFSRS